MSQKKRKPSKFDFDTLRASVQERANITRRVRDLINDLRVCINLDEICKYDLTEDEILLLLGTKFSVQNLCNLRKAIQHVPGNITRVVQGTAMRYTFINEVFKCLSARSDIMSAEEIVVIDNILGRKCPVFMSTEDKIQECYLVSNNLERYLTPPVSICTECDKTLSMRNKPS